MATNQHSERSGADESPSSFRNYVSKRRSRKADIVTGASSGHSTRGQNVKLRPPRERKAMGRMSRRRLESHDGRWITRPCWAACDACTSFCIGSASEDQQGGEKTIEEGIDEEGDDKTPQYTLESSRRGLIGSSLPCLAFRQNFCFLCSRTTIGIENEYHPDEGERNFFFLDVNNLISDYLNWSFCTSYLKLFGIFALFYFVIIVVYAAVYYVVALGWPMCINSNGEMIGEVEYIFVDCFQLSWTTFATVGYGLIYPATGASAFHVPMGCIAVGVLSSFEAFLGVLYAGFCTAVLFAKVLRSQNHAQVFFSDPIVVRYGKAELCNDRNNVSSEKVDVVKETVKEGMDEELGGDEEGSCRSLKMPDYQNIPCPSLEFRLVNRLHDAFSGEIVNAKLTCVAILNPKISDSDIDASTNNDNTEPSPRHDRDKDMNGITTINELAQVLRDTNARTRDLTFHSTESKQPHMFTEVSLDADEHPFFRRVWFGRHCLDENSPLLTPSVRHKIKLAGGYWPAELNNYQSIKNAIHFRHLLVCLSGTSNANAASVYAQKVYDLVDTNVGYRFVRMNYHTDQGSLKTDPYLLNAVYQQRGGGGEPMQ
mmetsp:Transcript_31890/g.60994  ORF Transcript_31890/g.60994 Transcript_31890/m.60994 type:complete len:597 (+) Transcript_31890:169-1959(+)|eukprot:CAMPEP_0201661566 /NCGR_PEP_ID=MMETSP0494-20130426/3901_1 /ASSEMBLY_ACC=CAM_ASM_000839 /TAXON_ID=420259 /ORGANISM="Thalassiosira gravida, Strain GMp14c1" /LENGTH=596 /DNA_ID=CAMNT_0048139715 /DNA_START=47 /DNA_END=1837 /DNA_ORIENTATION=+